MRNTDETEYHDLLQQLRCEVASLKARHSKLKLLLIAESTFVVLVAISALQIARGVGVTGGKAFSSYQHVEVAGLVNNASEGDSWGVGADGVLRARSIELMPSNDQEPTVIIRSGSSSALVMRSIGGTVRMSVYVDDQQSTMSLGTTATFEGESEDEWLAPIRLSSLKDSARMSVSPAPKSRGGGVSLSAGDTGGEVSVWDRVDFEEALDDPFGTRGLLLTKDSIGAFEGTDNTLWYLGRNYGANATGNVLQLCTQEFKSSVVLVGVADGGLLELHDENGSLEKNVRILRSDD